MGQNYIEYSLPSNLSRWHNRWFYIGNHQPGLPERNDVTPKWTVEWTQHPDATELDQVLELVKRIKALKAEGVTGASVVYSWITRRIQPLQKRETFGSEYLGTEDPSQQSAEELLGGEALKRVQRVPLDVHAVPYVPQLFSAENPPKQVQVSCKL